MKTSTSKEEAIKIKKDAIRYLNNTLEFYLNNNELKKAQLISKWIKDYCNFIRFEDVFVPTKNISYKRGDIVKVNFGFNVGNELGGVHYAVVLDKDNLHHSGTVTVIPLSSFKPGKDVYHRDLFIGTEFFNAVSQKGNRLLKEDHEKLDELTNLISALKGLSPEELEKPEIQEILENAEKQSELLCKSIPLTQKCLKEVSLMKSGSIAKIEQIRTISKIRILDPKTTGGVLYDIHLSESTMDKVNDKIKELFIFS